MPSQAKPWSCAQAVQLALEEELEGFKRDATRRLLKVIAESEKAGEPLTNGNIPGFVEDDFGPVASAPNSPTFLLGKQRKSRNMGPAFEDYKKSINANGVCDAYDQSPPGSPPIQLKPRPTFQNAPQVISVVPDAPISMGRSPKDIMNGGPPNGEAGADAEAPDQTDGIVEGEEAPQQEQQEQPVVRFYAEKDDIDQLPPWRAHIRRLVTHAVFDPVFGALVVLSVVLMGAEIESSAKNDGKSDDGYLIAQGLCAVAFSIEVILRVLAYDLAFFGIGKGTGTNLWRWNLFDVACAFTMLVDISVELATAADGSSENHVARASQLRSLRLFRLMRVVRAMRLLRMAKAAGEMKKMTYALQYSLSPLLWAICFLCFVMYFFAVLFTQAATETVLEAGALDGHLAGLKGRWGTVSISFFTLFKATTGGIAWEDCVKPLGDHTSGFYTFGFIVYVLITVFLVMNMITAIVVESAFSSVQHYKGILMQEKAAEKDSYVKHLREVFERLDHDHSGDINADEMAMLLQDPVLQQYLESMEINADDASKLFCLLDKDDSGSVSIEEFCNGCLKMKGEAKNYDIHCLQYETQRLMHKCAQHIDYLEQGFLPKVVKTVRKTIEVATPMLQRRVENAASAGHIAPTEDHHGGGGIKLAGTHYTINLRDCRGTISGILSHPSPPPISRPSEFARVHVPHSKGESMGRDQQSLESNFKHLKKTPELADKE